MVDERIHEIPLDAISLKGHIRSTIDESRVDLVASSFAIHGQLEPVRVLQKENGYEVLDGMHRCLAGKKRGWERIKAVFDERELSEVDSIETQLVLNTVRTDVSIPDRARNIAKLMEITNRSAAETASRLQISETTTTKLLAILKLPDPILDQVGTRIGLNAAYELAKVTDPEQQAKLAREIVDGRLTRDGVVFAVKRIKQPAAKATGPAVKRAVLSLGTGRSITVADDQVDFDSFITSCEAAIAKAKKARAQSLSFQTFLKVARDQAKG